MLIYPTLGGNIMVKDCRTKGNGPTIVETGAGNTILTLNVADPEDWNAKKAFSKEWTFPGFQFSNSDKLKHSNGNPVEFVKKDLTPKAAIASGGLLPSKEIELLYIQPGKNFLQVLCKIIAHSDFPSRRVNRLILV